MLSTLATYRLMSRDLDRTLALRAAEAPVALESQNYLERIGEIRSLDEFLADTRVFRFAMTAFGLEEMAFAKAYMRKVLSEGTDNPEAFVYRLNDPRFLEFARTFNFARLGEATTSSESVRQPVVDRYVRQSLEVAAGEENEGVRLALYFQRKAPDVTSAYGLLADAALYKVVRTALGLPDELAAAPLEKQAAAIEERLDIESLRDPEALERLIVRFTGMWDMTEATTSSPLLDLFNTRASASVSLDLALTVQQLRRGG